MRASSRAAYNPKGHQSKGSSRILPSNDNLSASGDAGVTENVESSEIKGRKSALNVVTPVRKNSIASQSFNFRK
jgi:hypothetical protein